MIEQNTSNVAGKLDGEDSAGRARITLQAPAELVTRAFEIADTFMDVAEQRGDVRLTQDTPRARLRRSLDKLDEAAGSAPGKEDEPAPESTEEPRT